MSRRDLGVRGSVVGGDVLARAVVAVERTARERRRELLGRERVTLLRGVVAGRDLAREDPLDLGGDTDLLELLLDLDGLVLHVGDAATGDDHGEREPVRVAGLLQQVLRLLRRRASSSRRATCRAPGCVAGNGWSVISPRPCCAAWLIRSRSRPIVERLAHELVGEDRRLAVDRVLPELELQVGAARLDHAPCTSGSLLMLGGAVGLEPDEVELAGLERGDASADRCRPW